MPVPSYTVNSATSITVTTPPHYAGTVDVMVATAGGSSEVTNNTRYTYEAEPTPTITSLSPTSGSELGGTVVTINGTRFLGASSVTFGGASATYFVNSDTQITATAPPHLAGTVHVRVETQTGTSPETSADEFTYTSASSPTVTALDVTSGPTAGGIVVKVTGTNFNGVSSVKFGNTEAASYLVVSPTILFATSPSSATTGVVHVRVTTTSGTSATSSADEFTYTASSAPTVSALSPSGGLTTGGESIVITGSNFMGTSSVKFGTTETNFTVLSSTTIEATAPPNAAGTVHVTVTTGGGTSSTSSASQYTYSAASAPTITSLSTTSGPTTGGTVVVVTGTHLLGVSEVKFGTINANFVINSDTQLTATAPPHAAATIDVIATSAAGSSTPSSSTRFTYNLASLPSITSISPTSGSTSGGTQVVISGSNFLGASGVFFGTAFASFTINSDTQITATSPAQAAGTVHVRVVSNAGSSDPVSADQFTYTAASAPTVTSLGTTTGPTSGNTYVHIVGTNFLGTTSVKFGSVEAIFIVNSATSITAWSPPQGAGTVHVTVTTGGGTSSTSSADQFTYSAASAPSISGLSPTSGPTTGGTTVVIFGSHFSAASAVAFGTTPAASFQVLSDAAISAVSPLAVAGTVDVRVTTAGGTSSIVTADQFTYTNVTTSAPTVTGVSPNTGAAAGGQVVVISGTNLAGASAVKFGSTDASSYTIDSNEQITAVAPAGSAGTVDVRVTTNNGTSAIVTADEFTYLATGAPTVTSLSTSSGTAAGGTTVVITGSNLSNASEVLFGSVAAASFTVDSSTQITAVTPAHVPATVHVTVTTPSGTSATSSSDQFTFSVATAPAVTSVSPSSGSTAGGTTVVIGGSNLGGATAVYFNGVAAASFVVDSGNQITAVTAPNVAGTGDVIVETTSGTSSPNSNARYTYTAASGPSITSLSPTTGPTAGGTTVVITGSNFLGTDRVVFGDVDATFTVDSATQITATSPPHDLGTVDVVVWTPTGSSAVSSSTQFTYNTVSPPSVSWLGTTSGSTSGGTLVRIFGHNFTGATQVLFGTESASFSIAASYAIVATSPSHAAGTVHVTVTTPAGTSSTSSADEFTYIGNTTPSVIGLSHAYGGWLGGTPVVISGTNFTLVRSVKFGSTEASYTVLSETAIFAYSPPGSGTVHVTVTTDGGTSSTSSADEFHYSTPSLPSITGQSSTSGSTAGGMPVTITGENLLGTTNVTIGGVSVPFIVESDSSISVTTPPHTAGTFDVIVEVPGASSDPARFTFTAVAAPTVSSLGTSSGSTIGGTSVTISGSDFLGTSAVLFGGMSASFEVLSATSILAIAPPSVTAGVVDVVIFTPTGSSAVSSDDEFTYSAATTPTLNSLSITSGSTIGGIIVNLMGSDFLGATEVMFGTQSVPFTIHSDTWITATVLSAAAGTLSVTVASPGGNSSGQNFTFSAPSAPTITSLTPASGPTIGGNEITVLGTGFLAATAVKFGTTDAVSFQVLSDSALRVTVPGGSAGTVDLRVTTAGGTSSIVSADQYTYTTMSAPTVTAVSPSSGSGSGGSLVTITGTNLSDTGMVLFGGVPADFVVISSTSIAAIAPPHVAGTVHITVATGAGTSSTSSSDEFTFSAASAPAISSLAQPAGPLGGGNAVLIVGSNFTGASNVTFGGDSALSLSVLSDTQIIATAPPGSAGTVDVRVVTPGGTSSIVSADQYTYTNGPTLSSISPAVDTATGGVPVTITGTNLSGVTAIYFGDVAATSWVVDSATSVTVIVPPHPTGAVDVSVVTAGGESGAQALTYNAATTVTWVGGSTGDWQTSSNWSSNVVPSLTDDVVIGSGKTVTISSQGGNAHRLTVAGVLVISGSSLNLAAESTVANLTLSGGAIEGAGNLTITSAMTWSGGTIGDAGSLIIASGATMTLDTSGGSLTVLGRKIANNGAINWATAGWINLGGIWENVSGSTFTMNSSASQSIAGTGGVMNNAGTVTKQGTGTATFSFMAFNNTGTLNVQAGTLALYTGNNASTISVSSGATLEFGSNYTLSGTSSISGTGAVEATAGTLTLGGTITASTFTIGTAATASGVATINANVSNDGTLAVGGLLAAGTLTINGNYTQTATLQIEIGGTTAGSGYDRLVISGTATLAGTLEVSYLNGFSPSSGQSFAPLTYGSYSGSFGSITGTTMTPQYNSGDFTLFVSAEIDPEDEEQWPEEEFSEDEESPPELLVFVGLDGETFEEDQLTPQGARDHIFAEHELLPRTGSEPPLGALAVLPLLLPFAFAPKRDEDENRKRRPALVVRP